MTTADEGTTTLSNGRVVPLPLPYEADVFGIVALADFAALAAAVPSGLTPVRIGPGTGLVTLAAIDYHAVGEFDPYNEFAVIVPVGQGAVGGLPLPGGSPGGWVHWLPVTTEPARRLGVDGWGYPKTVADIDIGTTDPAETAVEPRSSRRPVSRCRIAVEGEHVLTLTVRTGRTLSVDTSAVSYTEQSGEQTSTRVDLSGPMGGRPLDAGVHLVLGSHDHARNLQSLGLGRRLLGRQVLGRFWGERVTGAIHRGRRK